MNLQQIRDGFHDFGEVIYVVDSDYRTVAQGWSRADRTGPLDLIAARPSSAEAYVFRTGDFSRSDAQTLQAAVDAAVDFRGDVILLTPGAYNPAAVVTVDVPDIRLKGVDCAAPELARASITAGVTAALTFSAAADRAEVANLKFVPITEGTVFSIAAACENFYAHNFFYDALGITANTGTICFTVAGTTAANYKFKDFVARTNGAQGPLISVAGAASGWKITDFELFHGGGTTLAVALVTFSGALTGGRVERGRGTLTGLASSAVTNLIHLAADSGGDVQSLRVIDFRGSIGFCAADALVGLTGAEAGEVGLGACYLDVVSGGAGGAGTTYTA